MKGKHGRVMQIVDLWPFGVRGFFFSVSGSTRQVILLQANIVFGSESLSTASGSTTSDDTIAGNVI